MTSTVYAHPEDQDHELVDHLIAHAKPADETVVRTLEAVREAFRTVGHMVVDRAPRTPDRTVALRKIHEACMASISAVVLNQEVPTS